MDHHGFRRRGITRIHRADEAAAEALREILGRSTWDSLAKGPPENGPGREQDFADRLQAYWEKSRAIPASERWYRTLADDQAGNRAWREAADKITEPENQKSIPEGGPFAGAEPNPLAPGERPRFRGEPLRTNHEPTVAALMARRIASMLKDAQDETNDLIRTCWMAKALADWDPAAAVPTLREVTRICRHLYARPAKREFRPMHCAYWIAKFTSARDRAGDTGAIREYADWVRTTSPEELENSASEVLEPIYRRPNDPTLAATAAWLFEDPKSRWVALIRSARTIQKAHFTNLFASPIMEVPAFRKLVLAALDDVSPAGSATIGDNGDVFIMIREGDATMTLNMQNPRNRGAGIFELPTRKTEVRLRMCDYYAWILAMGKGAPAFDLSWPEAKRDVALAAMADFLRRKPARP